MKVSSLKKSNLTDEVIDKILFEGLEDTGDRGDCIIVLGSTKAQQYRVPKAVSIYKDSRAPKMLLCGGTQRKTASCFLSEAELMRRKALDLGTPDEAIPW